MFSETGFENLLIRINETDVNSRLAFAWERYVSKQLGDKIVREPRNPDLFPHLIDLCKAIERRTRTSTDLKWQEAMQQLGLSPDIIFRIWEKKDELVRKEEDRVRDERR